ncbi:MAG: HEAT repeat domain-containing protein [Acidobacteria bacterium]|nr:HEAT repeat domain-containing protein [Acidobacteriota bacterium]
MKAPIRICAFVLSGLFISCSPHGPAPSPPEGSLEYGDLSPEAVSLLEIIRDETADGQARMDALVQLGELGDRRLAKPLIDILERDILERTGIWAAAIPSLGLLGDPEAVPILVETLNKRDEDWLGREMAADALGQIGDPAAVEALMAAAHMADTRHSAIRALARIGDERAIGILIDAIDPAEDPETVESAKTGLIKIGSAALPALKTAFHENSPESSGVDRRRIIRQVISEIEKP